MTIGDIGGGGSGARAGGAYVEIVPKLDDGFNRQLADAVDGATKPALARFSDAFKRIGSGMMDAGKKLSLGVTLPIAAAGIVAFKLASDLNESMSKVGIVFGAAADDVLKWSMTSAKAFGMSRAEALEAAGTYGNLFRSMQIGEKPSADMSKRLVGLAGDLASFNNANPQDVLLALRAGLVGETEPLRRFGVNINQARLEAKALELGLWDGEEAISSSAKAQAAYALILEDTALAQGDFGRTAGGAANRQRTLTATMKDLGASIGTILLPIGEKLLGWAQKLMAQWQKLSPGMQRIIVIVLAVAAALGPLLIILGSVATGIGVLLSPIGLIVLAVAALAVAAFFVWKNWSTIWPKVQKIAGDVWAWLQEHAGWLVDGINAIIAGVTYVVEHWREIWEDVKRIAGQVWAWLEENVVPTFRLIAEAVTVYMDRVQDVIRVAVAIALWVWDHFGDRIMEAVRIAWEYVKGTIEATLEVIRGILNVFIGIFTLDFDRVWQGIQGIVSGAWHAIENIVRTGFATLLNTVGFLLDLLGILFSLAWDGIKSLASTVWDTIVSVVTGGIRRVVDAVGELPGFLFGILLRVAGVAKGIGAAIVDGIRDGIVNTAGLAGDIASGLVDVVRSAWNQFANRINDAIPDKIEIPFFPDIDLPNDPIPTFHSGGIVPGSLGQEVLIMAKAGERVLTADQDRRRGGGSDVVEHNVFYVENERELMRELEWQRATRAGNI